MTDGKKSGKPGSPWARSSEESEEPQAEPVREERPLPAAAPLPRHRRGLAFRRAPTAEPSAQLNIRAAASTITRFKDHSYELRLTYGEMLDLLMVQFEDQQRGGD